MNDVRSYLVQLRGQVDGSEINALSPIAVMVRSAEPAATTLAVCCDQSGLMGLLRHLHGFGLELLAVRLMEPGE